MRSISSAIITASGVLCLAIGGLIDHGDTKLFVMVVGAVVGLLGLLSWWSSRD